MKIKNTIERLIIWVIVIAITFSVIGLVKWVKSWFDEKPIVHATFDFENNPELNKMSEIKISGYNLTFNKSKDPTIIIDKPNKTINNYTEYKDKFYTPMVLFVKGKAVENNSGFTLDNVSDTETSMLYTRNASKDLFYILEGIEQDKTWEEIGINKEVLSGKIQLHIPGKRHPFTPYIKELFVKNLGVDITEENQTEINERVNKILEKCIEVEDPITFLVNSFQDKTAKKIALIAPAYIINDYEYEDFLLNSNSTKTDKTFTDVSITNTVNKSFSIYIKDGTDEKLVKKILNTIPKKVSSKIGYEYNKE